LKPSPSESCLLQKFYNYSLSLKELGTIENLEAYRTWSAAFLLHMMHLKAYEFAKPLCQGKALLEIGCNTGYGVSELATSAQRIVAVDSNEHAIQIASTKYGRLNIRYETVDALSLPFPSSSFDIVICFQVIEHVQESNTTLFLSEIGRVLKKEAIAIFSTPNRRLRLYPLQKPVNPEHMREYTARAFLKTLRSAFDIVEISGLRGEPWIEEIERKRVNKSLWHAAIKRPLKGILQSLFPANVFSEMKGLYGKFFGTSSDILGYRPNQQQDFARVVERFSMNALWFDRRNLERSIYFLATARNGKN